MLLRLFALLCALLLTIGSAIGEPKTEDRSQKESASQIFMK